MGKGKYVRKAQRIIQNNDDMISTFPSAQPYQNESIWTPVQSLSHTSSKRSTLHPLKSFLENKHHSNVREGERQYPSYIIQNRGISVIPAFPSDRDVGLQK